MRPMDAQNRPPEVATDQFALDRTLKHLRKLRWIGKESEAEKILAVLDVRRRQTVQTTTPGDTVCELKRTHLLLAHRLPTAVAQLVARWMRPLSLPAWLALAAFPGPPGTPFALRRAIIREEREKKSGLRAPQLGDRNLSGNRRSH